MSVFKRTALTCLISTALAAGAIACYPGGTPWEHSRIGYTMTRNFLSDLGMTVAYNGQPNRLGASLFVASLLLLVVGLGSSLAAIIHSLMPERAARGWATVAALLGLLACVAFAGVAVTPENRVMAIHVTFTIWAWRVVALVAVLMAIASLQSRQRHRRAAIAWLVVALVLAIYSGMLAWGPDLSTPSHIKTQVVAQKIAACVIMFGLLYVARETDRVSARSSG